MRVTNGMLAGNLMDSLGGLKERLARLQGQISSGKALERPSDAPAAYVDQMKVQAALQRLDRYGQNAADTRAWLNTTESALHTLGEILQRARELALQGANDTMAPADRHYLATEVDQLLRAAVDTANSDHNGEYVFGGFRSAAPPFTLDPATRAVTYNGDSGRMIREVGPGIQVQANVTGPDLQGAADLFAVLKELHDQLRSPAPAAERISATVLPGLDAAQGQLFRLFADVGARSRNLELLEARSRDLRINLETQMQETGGVDLARALVDLNTEETAYRAALAVGARILPQSLVDFLR